MAWFDIDKRLISIKAFYFFIFAGIASLLPYLPIYLTQRGLSSAEISTIYGLIFFTTFIKNTVIGYIADKYQLHKIILIVSCVLTGPLYCSLVAVPPVENLVTNRSSIALYCASNLTDHDFTNTSLAEFSDSCSFYQCNGKHKHVNRPCRPYNLEQSDEESCSMSSFILVQNSTPVYDIESTELSVNIIANSLPQFKQLMRCQVSLTCTTPPHPYTSLTFWLSLVVVLLAALCGSNEMMLNDAIAMTVLGDDRAKWGMSRLFGSVGYGVCAVLVSVLIVGLGVREEPVDDSLIEYTPAFYLYLALSLVSAIIACFHPNCQSVKVSQDMKGVRSILRDIRVVLFLLLVLFLGMFNGVTMTFGYLYLRLHLKASQMVLGLCVLVSVLAEIPILFIGGRIVNKIGTRTALYLALFAYFVRLYGYVYIPNAWWALLIEVTHMFTFGLMFTAATMHASKVACERTIGTMIGLVNGLKWGLGLALGTFIGGQIGQAYGFKFLFQATGAAALIVMTAYIIINEVLVRCLCPSVPADTRTEEVNEPDTKSPNDEEMKLYSPDNSVNSGSSSSAPMLASNPHDSAESITQDPLLI